MCFTHLGNSFSKINCLRVQNTIWWCEIESPRGFQILFIHHNLHGFYRSKHVRIKLEFPKFFISFPAISLLVVFLFFRKILIFFTILNWSSARHLYILKTICILKNILYIFEKLMVKYVFFLYYCYQFFMNFYKIT